MIRRVLVTGTVTVATVLGSATGVALAATQAPRASDSVAAPTLSTASVRPGTAFTVSPPASCPAESGEQVVYLSYTDSEDTTYQLATLTTDSSGDWNPTTVRLPVAGLDETGSWDSASVAKGAGTVDVVCLNSDYVMARAAMNDFSSMLPGHRQAMIDPPSRVLEDDDDDPDDPGDPDQDPDTPDEDDNVTRTYAPAALTVSGVPARVSVTPALAEPGNSITVAPVDVCDSAGSPAASARVQVSPTQLGQDEDPGTDDDGDDSSDDGSDDGEDISGLGAEADPQAIVSAQLELTLGAWPTTKLEIPDDAPLGDYAVTVDCLGADQEISSRYQAAALALGTLQAGAPVCSTKGAAVRLTGTYPGTLVTGSGDQLDLPATLRLTGAGPWNISLDSALTEGLLLKQKVSCPAPDYELSVPKTGLGSAGEVRARICNTGEAEARALLQVVAKNKKFVTVDRRLLDRGECAWLDGGKVKKGSSAKARVLLDPPGKGSTDQEVERSFTVRRKG